MKLALVTGGSRGLGASVCNHYRALGWRVIDFSRSGSGKDNVAIDLGRPLEAATVIAGVLQSIPQDGLEEIVAISNAARLGPVGAAGTLDDGEALDHVAVNLGGGIVFMSAVLRAFESVDCRKTLVNITSGAARRAIRGWSLYCAAKAGLERYVECLALEQGGLPHPFRVINISPGVIDTGMQAEIRDAGPDAFPDHALFVALKQEGSLRTADEVAARVARIVAGRPDSGGRYEVDSA